MINQIPKVEELIVDADFQPMLRVGAKVVCIQWSMEKFLEHLKHLWPSLDPVAAKELMAINFKVMDMCQGISDTLDDLEK